MNRKIAFKFTFNHEGGTNFLIHDRGGLTKYGICQRQYPDLDIENLTLEQAEEIYIRDYWQPCRCDDMELPLAVVIYDSAVNCGVSSACTWLQKAVNKVSNSQIKVDGIVGPVTLSEVQLANPYDLAGKIISSRLKRYTSLIQRDPTQRTFVLGWMNRVSDLLDFI